MIRARFWTSSYDLTMTMTPTKGKTWRAAATLVKPEDE